MEIYWIEDRRRRGPVSVPDLLSMIEAGEVTWETQGWHCGCAGWMPLRDLPSLAYYAQRSARSRAEGETPEEGSETGQPTADLADSAVSAGAEGEDSPGMEKSEPQIVPMPSPSLRLLARLVDCFLYLTLAFGLLRAIGSGFHLAYGTPLFWIPMCFVEGWIVSRFGTTPGKKLLGFGVTTFDGGPLALGTSTLRAGLVFLLGMGMMYFPVLPPLMMGMSWYQARRRGLTSWDARLRTVPRMRVAAVRPERIMLALVIMFICLQATGWILLGWAPEIQQSLHEAMSDSPPEMHRMIDSLFH